MKQVNLLPTSNKLHPTDPIASVALHAKELLCCATCKAISVARKKVVKSYNVNLFVAIVCILTVRSITGRNTCNILVVLCEKSTQLLRTRNKHKQLVASVASCDASHGQDAQEQEGRTLRITRE